MEEHKFNLKDSKGNSHAYRVRPIPLSQGLGDAIELASYLAEPGIRLVQLGIQAKGADVELGELLRGIDFSQLGGDVAATLRKLAARPEIILRMFDGCVRDDKDLGVDGAFDAAYTANLGEMLRALAKIIEINGYLDFLGSSQN